MIKNLIKKTLRALGLEVTRIPKRQLPLQPHPTALRSKLGASYKLIQLIKKSVFQLNLSVPLALEYEAVAKRTIG